MTGIRRRDLLTGAAALVVAGKGVAGEEVTGQLPWQPGSGSAPAPFVPGAWKFLTNDEAAVMGVVADLIIPPDPQTPGGREAGCVVYLDRQLEGAYGEHGGQYVEGPFQKGIPQQGPQDEQTPRELYRKGIEALNRYAASAGDQSAAGAGFAHLDRTHQEQVLHGMEAGTVQLEDVDAKAFFEQMLKDIQQGFFADPIYGGNRDMCSWKMIGFPGARYDYTDWVGRHNERYPHPPASIAGRPEWNPKG